MFEKPGESLQNISKTVFVIGIIVMVIVSLITLVGLLEELEGLELLLSFLLLIIVDAVVIFSLYAQCLLFSCLGRIAENTTNIEYRIFNNNSKSDTYTQSSRPFVNYGTTQSSEKAGANQWQCKKCGKIMADYVGSCGCGNTKHENKYL